MAEPNFANRIKLASNDPDSPREGLQKERQQTGRSFHLELHPKSGGSEGFAWALYQRYKLFEGEPERLEILFSEGAVVVTGYNLKRAVEIIADEGLRAIVEHDQAEVMLIEAENRKAEPLSRKAVILSVKAEPDFETAYKQATTMEEPHGHEDTGYPEER